jgi:hypothetical protein
MKKITRTILSSALTLCILSPSAHGDEAKQRENCQTVKQLLLEYESRYKNVRGAKREYSNITIWKTPIQLIDNRCEIWEWSHGKIRYMCSLVLPNENSARLVYKDAKEKIAQCLSNKWTQSEQTRKSVPGSMTQFSHADHRAIVTLHVIKSDTLFTDEWNTYLFIGDKEEQF